MNGITKLEPFDAVYFHEAFTPMVCPSCFYPNTFNRVLEHIDRPVRGGFLFSVECYGCKRIYQVLQVQRNDDLTINAINQVARIITDVAKGIKERKAQQDIPEEWYYAANNRELNRVVYSLESALLTVPMRYNIALNFRTLWVLALNLRNDLESKMDKELSG